MFVMVISTAGAGKPKQLRTALLHLPPLLGASGELTIHLIWSRNLNSVVIRREVQDEIRVRKGIDIPMTRVIMTSDDRNETWWDEVKSYGWARMDHTEQQTVEHYGRWYVIQSLPSDSAERILILMLTPFLDRYPVILDSAIQSNGLGFVGTDRSTFSILSMRRVQDWHGGATRLVKWGKKDADAHRKRMAMEYPE